MVINIVTIEKGKTMKDNSLNDIYAHFDNLTGSSDQVQMAAAVINFGLALQTDIYPDGLYNIPTPNTHMKVVYEKSGKRVTPHFEVPPATVNAAISRVMAMKEAFEKNKHMEDEAMGSPAYYVPKFVETILLIKHDVHPEVDVDAFERKLWEEFPELWIDTRHAPKSIIRI